MSNERTVFVAHANERKDLKAAEQFGRLKDVFGNVGRTYNTPKMIEHARRVLEDWEPGDHILLIGDPGLCGVVIAVALERDEVINTLSWDRNTYQYISRRWDFSPDALEVNPADTTA